jgi:prepilin-type N-terminal cleavage/methylation domain-containing protein
MKGNPMFSGSYPPKRRRSAQAGFTLVELLVVMIIIGILIMLLVPAVQKARETARVTSCANNLRQIALAATNFEARNGAYPPSMKMCEPDANGRIHGWSIHALLLPHLEQGSLFSKIDFTHSLREAGQVVTADGSVVNLASLRVPTYLCPSEQRDEPRVENGEATNYPFDYAFNLGVWFVYDPQTGQGGAGMCYPGSQVRAARVTDGLSYTLCAAEVKGWTPYYRGSGLTAPELATLTPSAICGLGGSFQPSGGHTEWPEGRAVQIGFTTAFAPNTKVFCEESGTTYDVDWSSQGEGISTTVPTYAAVTARSYHAGGVNTVMLDCSIRWFRDDVDLGVWRAFSTRQGGELIPSKDQ